MKNITKKIQEASQSIEVKSRNASQIFVCLWEEEFEVLRELEKRLQTSRLANGRERSIALACSYLLNDLKNEKS